MPRRNELLLRCQHNRQLFCTAIEEQTRNRWKLLYSFEVEECVADCVGEQDRITGVFENGDRYHGCPYCHSQQFVVCGKCGKLTCWNGEGYRCAWCGTKGDVKILDHLELKGGGI